MNENELSIYEAVKIICDIDDYEFEDYDSSDPEFDNMPDPESIARSDPESDNSSDYNIF